jgi:dihydroflavonol-4-reductase
MKVLVTGANGHLGYNLCKALIEKGYKVRASIRSLADTAKANPLRALGDIELVALDIRNAAQFEEALTDIETVFHVAATYAWHTGSPEKDREMIRDSVEGAENALQSAAKTGCKKVVLTSSVVALPLRLPGAPAAKEAEWNTNLSVPYVRAKTEAERAAWRLATALDLDLVTVLPGALGGPGFLRRTATIDVFEAIMLGAMRLGLPNFNIPYVDIRDVITGHILAAEKNVSGRFIISNDEQPTLHEVIKLMHTIDPAVPLPLMAVPEFLVRFLPLYDSISSKLLGSPRILGPERAAELKGHVYCVSNTRARKELGWEPRISLQQSLKDTMVCIRALRRQEGKTRVI